MKQKPSPTRRAAAMLLVAAVLPFTPGLAQDAAAPPVVNVPPLTITPPAASPTPAAPTMGAPAAVRGPVVEHVASPGAAPAAPAATRTARAAPAHATASTRTASARTSTPARSAVTPPPATAPASAAPTADTSAPVSAGAAPILAVPPAAPAPQSVAAAAPAQDTPIAWWPFVAGLAILVIGAAVLIARRRRRAEEEAVYDEEPAYAEPVAEAPLVMPAEYQQPIVAPVYPAPAAEPVAAPAEPSTEMEIAASDPADIEALAATAAPHPGRPWLEFLMRPVRAGASGDEARVEFELTVGNTGAVQARDVRVSTWMVASGDGTDMESSLIEPPAGAAHREMSIAPGEGAMVEGAIVMPRDDNGPVLPVVVADARYRLPDGSEGRTSASFAIGRPGADGVRPLRAGSGFTEDVEAELHGEPERV